VSAVIKIFLGVIVQDPKIEDPQITQITQIPG
jgi:hypothetical protein